MIVPPQKMETLYLKLYQHIFESARKFQIPQSDADLGAVYKQISRVRVFTNRVFLFFRPNGKGRISLTLKSFFFVRYKIVILQRPF